MGGGLFQLVCRGQQDSYFCQNPDISYFKYAYKKHSVFAIDIIRLEFDNIPLLDPEIDNGIYNCKILRKGDLLKELYFCFTLPDIYSSSELAFKWVKNIGNVIIKKATIKVGNIIIDTITSDWLNIWNELTSCKDNTDIIVGNKDSLINPSLINSKKIVLQNNKFIYNYYPNSSINSNSPSIKSNNLCIPLSFWFTKNPALALPLLRLQNSEIVLTIYLENSEKLYTVYSYDLNENISPIFYNKLYANDLDSGIKKKDNINIKYFTKNLHLFPYIEANYIFLGDTERETIINKAIISYPVEQIDIIPQSYLNSTNNNIMLTNNNKPTKEIIWATRREDYITKFNSHSNYTASFRQDNDYPILDKVSILWNKNIVVIDEKDADFFNKIQTYKLHSNIPSQGIYVYSFALMPEKQNPSGYYNGSLVSTTLSLSVNNYNDTDVFYNLNNKLNKFSDLNIDANINNNYFINIYCLSYNVFETTGGIGALKFI